MIKIIDTTAIKAIISNTIADLASNYEITTTTSSRTSHGKTTATSTTQIRRKPAPAEPKKAPEEPWIVEAEGWTPSVGRRVDGFRELWGTPKVSKSGNITVVVKLVDDDIVIREYTIDLTATIEGQLETCRRMATAALITGRHAYITSDIMRARRLIAHHKWEKTYEDLRKEINELFMELNEIAEIANSARKEARTDVERLQEELKQARNTLERSKMLSHHSHSSDEWIREICKALAENLGGTADDIRIARDIAERRLRESDVDED